MQELSTLSELFSDDTKKRTYFVAKIFCFSLKVKLKLGIIIYPLVPLIVLWVWLILSFVNIIPLVLNMFLCRGSLILSRMKERKCLKHGQSFVLYSELDLDINCPRMNFLIYIIMDYLLNLGNTWIVVLVVLLGNDSR